MAAAGPGRGPPPLRELGLGRVPLLRFVVLHRCEQSGVQEPNPITVAPRSHPVGDRSPGAAQREDHTGVPVPSHLEPHPLPESQGPDHLVGGGHQGTAPLPFPFTLGLEQCVRYPLLLSIPPSSDLALALLAKSGEVASYGLAGGPMPGRAPIQVVVGVLVP